MGLPEVYCSVCGASFGNPYDSLVDDPNTAYLVQGHTNHDFEVSKTRPPDIRNADVTFQWLHDAQLFGIPSSLETSEELKPVVYADMPAYKRTDEHPAFFGDPYCHYGEGNVFHLGGRTYPTHYPINNGDILFAMHSNCANIIKRVFVAKQDGVIAKDGLPTLRAYYDKLRQQCPGYVDEWWNIYWPHEYYGACDYWGYDEWEYAKGCQKFLVDPLHDKNLTAFVLEVLKPAQPREEAPLLLSKTSNRRTSGLDSLPTEIIDQVVALLPTASALSLRLVSSTFATRIQLTQRFFREQLLGGNLVPYLWDLDVKACRDMQQGVPEGEDPDWYWDWRQLTRYLNDVASIVEHDPDSSGIPRGFWNRCRLWLTVVEAEVW
ncbi:hypothetical protein BU25DRAFT_420777 [Macroventuria anomochaeta]|uniref:Uncharacterized protein n=1 Tax=Macroventuria anomochaeta TaxID=301207 RepID=A0ACB6S4G1_9PLEO|nr:uncharacterized protein BU25DRAFT_420777 [Macroventuria anomochaeta]KAF2628843.1 hypothetical protein BU25DRAFT_420777 [Macroventuria anomochaeta]